jgi:hypothetical protein
MRRREACTDISVSISKPPGHGWEALGKPTRESAVAGEDIGEIVAEQRAKQRVEDAVAEGVALASGIRMHAAPRADDHVGAFGDQRADEFRRVGGRIGPVAVGHDVDIRLDVGEHAAHHIALALAALAHDGRARKCGAQRGRVGGIVVVDIDAGGGQRCAEIRHDIADRLRLVIAGQQDGNLKVFQQGFRHDDAVSVAGRLMRPTGFTIS